MGNIICLIKGTCKDAQKLIEDNAGTGSTGNADKVDTGTVGTGTVDTSTVDTSTVGTDCSDINDLIKELETKTSTSDLKTLYVKSLEYNCTDSNTTISKQKIYDKYQDALLSSATKFTEEITSNVWTNKGTTDEEKLAELNSRIEYLSDKKKEVNDLYLQFYDRDVKKDSILKIYDDSISETQLNFDISINIQKINDAKTLFVLIAGPYKMMNNQNVTLDSIDLSLYRKKINLNSYKACLMFSEFQPLLYPTDNSKIAGNGTTASEFTDETIKKYLSNGNIETYVKHIMYYYTKYYYQSNLEQAEKDGLVLDAFYNNTQIDTLEKFYIEGKKILKQFGVLRWKMLPYMAQKIPCSIEDGSTFSHLPSTWPMYFKDVEAKEAILVTLNVCYQNFGGNTVKYFADLNLSNEYSRYYTDVAWTDEKFSQTQTDFTMKSSLELSEQAKTKWLDRQIQIITVAEQTNPTQYISNIIFNYSAKFADDLENVKINGLTAESKPNGYNNYVDFYYDILSGRIEAQPTRSSNGSLKAGSMYSDIYNNGITCCFSSIDFLTLCEKEYDSFNRLTYYLYYHTVPESLNFYLILPLNITNSTISLCNSDVINGCAVNNLMPFVFGKRISNGIEFDPLFDSRL